MEHIVTQIFRKADGSKSRIFSRKYTENHRHHAKYGKHRPDFNDIIHVAGIDTVVKKLTHIIWYNDFHHNLK